MSVCVCVCVCVCVFGATCHPSANLWSSREAEDAGKVASLLTVPVIGKLVKWFPRHALPWKEPPIRVTGRVAVPDFMALQSGSSLNISIKAALWKQGNASF